MNDLIVLFSNQSGVASKFSNNHNKNKSRIEDIGLPTFDLSILAYVTEHFSTINNLGEGDLGPIYKVMNESDI